jgi:hypothetical protein
MMKNGLIKLAYYDFILLVHLEVINFLTVSVVFVHYFIMSL